MRALRIAAVAEAVSLVILLVNLATVHAEVITSLGGPVHGTSYLAVIALATPAKARWLALIPGVGGLLAVNEAQKSAI